MLPASNKGVGMNMGFPDPCLTMVGPVPTPVPYPNMAMNALAAVFSPNIFLTMMPALNMSSLIPMTMGDEAGALNVIFKMMGGYSMGNPKILVNCLPGINLGCTTFGNLMNNPIGAALVPSITNVLFTYKDGEQDGTVGPRDHRAECAPAEEMEALALAMTRGDSVRARLVAGVIGYVKIEVFASDTAARAHGALRRLSARGMQTLVIDLRGCPGGDAEAAIDLAAELLPMGAEVATIVDEDGDEVVHRSARAYDWRAAPRAGEIEGQPLPVRVVVDRMTASAAEIFAGALAAHGRAEIIGGPTFGKSQAARVVRQRATGAPIRVPAGHCLLPGRSPIDARPQ